MADDMRNPVIEIQVGDPAPAPPPLRSEADVTATWNGDRPVVSVVCPTYEHAGFIADAVRGILGQVTDFPFELLIRDDASTDGTAETVADFRDRYPHIIRAILERENRWPNVKAEAILYPLVRGDYVAVCEGDDYWLDPRKLQTQVESLRKRPEAVLSHHQSLIIEAGIVKSLAKLPAALCRDFSAAELRLGAWALTNTMLHRNVSVPFHPQAHRIVNGDNFYRASLGVHGGAVFETAVLPAVYRRHHGGIWSLTERRERDIREAESDYWIGSYFADQGKPEVARHFLIRSARRIAASHLAEGLDVRREVYPRGIRTTVVNLLQERAPALFSLGQRIKRLVARANFRG